MKSSTSPFPLVKLPKSLDQILFLICEDLKNQKFFNGLEKVGLEYCYYRGRLGKLVLMKMGLDDGSDEVFDFYYRLMEERSKKIETDRDTIVKQAIKVYVELACSFSPDPCRDSNCHHLLAGFFLKISMLRNVWRQARQSR